MAPHSALAPNFISIFVRIQENYKNFAEIHVAKFHFPEITYAQELGFRNENIFNFKNRATPVQKK